jgi:hypothetical protein
MGALITFYFIILFCFLGKSHIHWPINKSFGTLSTPQWEHLFGPQSQNRNKCAPLHFTFVVYVHGSWTFGKPRCYWEHLGERIWEYLGNLMGTRGEKKKVPLSAPPQKEKPAPFMRACWAFPMAACNFSFQNCVSSFLGSGNGRGRILGT